MAVFEKIRKNCRKGIFTPHLEKYLDYLLQESYLQSRIYHIMESVLHFAKYLHMKKIKCLSQISLKSIENYISYKNKKIRQSSKSSLQEEYKKDIFSIIKKFLLYLSQQGVIKLQKYFKENQPYPELIVPFIKDYLSFCRVYRNLCSETIEMHLLWIMRLGKYLQTKRIKDFKSLKITDIDNFIQNYTSLSRSRLKNIQGILRSFLRYIFITGDIHKDLSVHITSPIIYQDKLIPKHISWEEVKLVLKQVDINTAQGSRDYAILVLLANYGLRSQEVAQLKIKDIDWKEKKITFPFRKSGNELILPLKEEVFHAILHYLKSDRPKKDYPQVFLTLNAPIQPLCPYSVGEVAKKYIKKAGLNPPSKGAHIFRHSLSKHLLESGVSLVTISKILGHKSICSTMIYTRIDMEQLREVTDNYANLL